MLSRFHTYLVVFLLSLVNVSPSCWAMMGEGDEPFDAKDGLNSGVGSSSSFTEGDEGQKEMRFVLYTMPTREVLVPLDQRARFGLTLFQLARTRGSFIGFEDDRLFHERIYRLRSYLRIPDETSLDETESQCLVDMITAGQNLIRYAHPHTLIDPHPFYTSALQQFTEASFRYLHHRVRGIDDHLNTRSVQVSCGGLASFEAHKDKQKAAISSYYQQSMVRDIICVLRDLAPALEEKKSNVEELVVGPRNSYQRPFVDFETPPALESIRSGLTALNGIADWQREQSEEGCSRTRLDKCRLDLQDSVKGLTVLRSFLDFSQYLKILSYIEHLAQPTLTSDNWDVSQKAFWYHQLEALWKEICAQIEYKYLDVNGEKVREQENRLRKTWISPEERIEAYRYFHHYRIQWPRLKFLGLLVSSRIQQTCPSHKNILLAAANELTLELRKVMLPRLEAWLNFELAVAAGPEDEIEGFYKEADLPTTPTLSLLASYAADVAYLTKLDEMSKPLSTFTTLPTPAMARLLTIIGECAKNLSEFVKLSLGGEVWNDLAKMRNKLHHSRAYLRKIIAALEGTPELPDLLLSDLTAMFTEAQGALGSLPTTWEEIKVRYNAPKMVGSLTRREGIVQLLETIDTVIKRKERKALMKTKPPRTIDEEVASKVSSIRDALQNTQAARLTLKQFNERLRGLSLTPNQRKQISDFYGILQGGGLKKRVLAAATKAIEDTLTKIQEGKLEGDNKEAFEALKELLAGEDTSVSKSEAEWKKAVAEWEKAVDTTKIKEREKNKIKQGLRALYPSSEVEKEEEEARQTCLQILSKLVVEDEEWGKEAESLIKRLSGFTTPVGRQDEAGPSEVSKSKEDGEAEEETEEELTIEKNLLTELNRLGITNQQPWEKVRRNIQLSRAKQGKPTSQELLPFEHVQKVLKDSQTAVTQLKKHFEGLKEHFEDLKKRTASSGLKINFNDIKDDPSAYFPIEHHLEMMRQYVEMIGEAVTYLVHHDIWLPYTETLNNFYRILSLKLKGIRVNGNYLAHLHDVTEFELYPYRVRETLFEQAYFYIYGFSYEGRDGQPGYLSSLLGDLDTYVITLLGPLYDKATEPLPGEGVPPAKKEELLTVYNANFNGQPIQLKEEEISGRGGNCGFIGLGLDRATSIKKLMSQLNDPHIDEIDKIDEMVRDDVTEAFRGRDLPPRLMRLVLSLANQIDEQEETIAGILDPLNDQYAGAHDGTRLTLEKMIEALKAREDQESQERSALLLAAQQERNNLEGLVWEQLLTPEALTTFLREEFLESGRWLSYVPGQHGTLYALAYLHNLEVHIWTRQEGGLVETFSVPARVPDAPANIIHLHHTNYGQGRGLNHFNLLVLQESTQLEENEPASSSSTLASEEGSTMDGEAGPPTLRAARESDIASPTPMEQDTDGDEAGQLTTEEGEQPTTREEEGSPGTAFFTAPSAPPLPSLEALRHGAVDGVRRSPSSKGKEPMEPRTR